MSKVWVVGVSDCESNYTVRICSTKAIAERELFKTRDEFIKDWKRLDENNQKSINEFCKKEGKPSFKDDMYKKMIKNLSSNDYENWDNYPLEKVYISEMEIIDG